MASHGRDVPVGIADLAGFGVPMELVDRWLPRAQFLTDIQQKAISAGLLRAQHNLLVSAPTSSGKTFIGELVASTAAFRDRRRALFAVPFKALAEEHYAAMRSRYADLLTVVISDGDRTEFDDDIRRGDFNIAVLTYEKLTGLAAQYPDIVSRASTLIIDEIQLIGDESRGPNLERFLTRTRLLADPPRLIALSASLDDVASLRQWLNAEAVVSNERPIPLVEMVADVSGRALRFDGEGLVEARRFPAGADRDSLTVEIASTLAGEGQQILVFRSTVAPTRTTAEAIARRLPATGVGHGAATILAGLEESENVSALSRTLASRVAFHNADLTFEERQLVEGAFRDGEVRVLVSTTTLAMGVNLPSDWVVISDTSRFVSGRVRDIPVGEYKNAAGRAGRLGQKEAGYSVVLADDPVQARQIVNALILGLPDAVESQIPRRPFEDLVFAVIADDLAKDGDGVVEFVSSSYAYQTFYEPRGDGLAVIRQAVDAAIDACIQAGLFAVDGAAVLPTAWAKQFSQAGLGAGSAVQLANALGELASDDTTPSDALFAVAACREVGDRPWVPKVYGQLVDPRTLGIDFREHNANGALAKLLARSALRDEEMGTLIRLGCLIDWVSGLSSRDIARKYRGAAPVRVQGLGRSAAWLLETMARAAEVAGATPPSLRSLRQLAMSCRFGLPPQVVNLARLRAPGITRETLVELAHNNLGVDTFEPDAVLDASPEVFKGLLSPAQLASLQSAIERDTAETLARRLTGHISRANVINLPERLISQLYTTSGLAFEQAVLEALQHIGLPAVRVTRQPHGEEDIRLAHGTGTVVISVTASLSEGKPISWSKAREVLGAGAGFNPVNFVCIGRPRFDALAVTRANQIAQEAGVRRLLLISVPAIAELILRSVEGRLPAAGVADLLASRTGAVEVGDLVD
jgi:helicase